jgi:SAM-dependent methyltransferase
MASAVKSLREKRHYLGLRRFLLSPAPDYDHYLRAQLKRTFIKDTRSLLPRTPALINMMIEKANPPRNSKILCVGCRNTAELDYFQSMGFPHVVGIDLFSEDSRIQVMDMHNLTFGENSFDIVYSSHSLEHSYDIQKVAQEFVRVTRDKGLMVIEIPVRYPTTEADRYDLKNVNGLISCFSPFVGELLWSAELEVGETGNYEGTPVAKALFRIKK